MRELDRELLRRVKVYSMSDRDIVDCLEGKVKAVFPEGSIVIGVSHDFSLGSFLLKVQNSSFDVLKDGECMDFHAVELHRTDKG